MTILRSGKLFMPGTDETLDYRDIGHGLCRQIRFNGASAIPYTVMQHTLVGAQQMPVHFRWAFLLHDSTEVVMSDCVRPWKPKEFADTEAIILERILKGFGLPSVKDWPEEATMMVQEIDMMCACAEAVMLFGESAREWCKPWIEPTDEILKETRAMLPMSAIWIPQPQAGVEWFRVMLLESLNAWKAYSS